MAMLEPAARPTGQRERNKIDKLRRIENAARELFIAKGFDDTTTREIALRAGVGLGTIFVYAANKRDLLFLIVNDELKEITKEAETSISERASLLENLLKISRRHYEYFGLQPALSRLVLREMVFYDLGAQAGRFQKTRERLIELIGNAVQLAIVQKDDLRQRNIAIYRLDNFLHFSGRAAPLAFARQPQSSERNGSTSTSAELVH